MHISVFIYSNRSESGADEKIQLEKDCICDLKKTWAGHKLPAPSFQQWGGGEGVGLLHTYNPTHILEAIFFLMNLCNSAEKVFISSKQVKKKL